MPRRLRWVLLCEDLEHERLLRPLLTSKLGRPTRIERAGSFSYVLKQLPREVAYVRRYAQEAVALVVASDADTRGFESWLRALREKGDLQGKSWAERVALVVPSYSVETWILWLCGADDLNEITDYSNRVKNQKDGGMLSIRQAVDSWHSQPTERRALEPSRLPALTHARAEIDRLSQLAKD